MRSTTDREQKLAHILVTELLAYQFAMAVRWSETQTVLFDEVKAERLIEIGPSSTLLNMAKRTLDRFNAHSDTANGINRALLSITKNHDEVHYETYSSPQSEVKREDATQPELEPQNQTVVAAPATHTVAISNTGTLLPDKAVSALEALTALVAQSLRISESELKLDDSIKSLSKGRSTIQNEIIGDMLEEFGSLPEDAENTPLKELAGELQKSYQGILRKCLRNRIEKLVSSKMPGSVDMKFVRSYLSTTWSLPPGRQDSVLLRALSQQPAARISKSDEAQTFLDSIAQSYMKDGGLKRPTSNSAALDPGKIMLDSKILAQIKEEQRTLRNRIASILAEDEYPSDLTTIDDDGQADSEKKLTLLETELGEDFCSGISPIFQPQKARSYDSTWNWVHVDLLTLFHKYVSIHSLEKSNLEDILSLQSRLRNRWTPRSRKAWKYLLQNLPVLPGTRGQATKKFLENLDAELDEKTQAMNPDSDFDSTLISSSAGPLQILRKRGADWVSHPGLTKSLNIKQSATFRLFTGKNVLLTGAGPFSIGMAMLPSLLQGGAKVVVTTTRPMSEAGPIYQKIFAAHGGNDSKLVVLPCNQASKRDIEELIKHIYDPISGLGWDLDFLIPFAALSEKGREIDNLDSRSELAHRAMLTNVLRLMGAIKTSKEARNSRTRPAQVLLPLSPNIGMFGKDGLYSESKIGLMVVLNKWSSESWSDYISLCGVKIGWTRGTGLMADNDFLAKAVSKVGVTTFSVEEMAAYILRLMSDPIVSICQSECLLADISGGMSGEFNLADFIAEVRKKDHSDFELKRALAVEEATDAQATLGTNGVIQRSTSTTEPLLSLSIDFPKLPNYHEKLKALNNKLGGMVDLESVVVVVGFAEIGPWGNSRTRWEMEKNGELSPQGCIELAWMTGLVQYDKAAMGWIDTASKTPIKDGDVKKMYGKIILENVGLRFINPSPLDHPDREKRQFLQEIVVQHDMEPFTASYDNAMEFARENGAKVTIKQIPGSEEYSVRLRKDAVIFVPKSQVYERMVGGQIPTQWDPQVYGLPQDICDSVDRCTHWSLVCAAEAFLSAGLTDIYELYKTIHVTELGNCVGSGMGGGRSLQKLFRERYLERPVQNDILAETFINTTGAWLNMLLMSSAGPTRTPVAACATALESLNQGYDLIVNGTAKVCLVGGYDDMTQDTSDEFGRMKATNNNAADLRRGRAPHEMSRPCASSRSGFIESEGCGMQVLTSAKVALELGLPIRSIVAHVSTASDGIGRSIPAPGKGILSTVRENSSAGISPLLDIKYRKRLMEHSLRSIREVNTSLSASSTSAEELELSILREEKEARRRFGNSFWTHDPRISPLRGALAVWGLTADDIGVLSMHGTSTEMNEKNEVEVLHRQLDKLGRSPGNAALAVCQKYLTGHPKGAAAAWMLNGCCQILESGVVPGNRNADNIDAALEQWEHLVFPNQSITLPEINAFSVTSFGFGQKGAQALGVHPKFLFATLNHDEYNEYSSAREARYHRTQQQFQNAFYGGKMVTLKDEPPYAKEQTIDVLMDSAARF